MKQLLNLREYEIKENNKKLIYLLKLKRKMFKLAANSPLYISNFLINFQKFDKPSLDIFIEKINQDYQLKNFLYENEKLYTKWQLNIGLQFRNIFNFIFYIDDNYKRIALKISKLTNFLSLEYLYILINYIDDNLPINIVIKLKEEDKRLIKFLLYYGDEINYIQKYHLQFKDIKKHISKLCFIFDSDDIYTVINLILIEKCFRKQNTKILDTLKNL